MHADREAEEVVDLPHPFGVALGEIIVHGHDVDAAARERVEIDRQRCDQRLAFAGLHLGDPAFMQNHAANQLDVEMALPKRAFASLAHRCERGDQQIVERRAFGNLLAELRRARAQLIIAELFQLLFQGVDRIDASLKAANAAVVGRAKKFSRGSAEHAGILSRRNAASTHPLLAHADRKVHTFRVMSYTTQRERQSRSRSLPFGPVARTCELPEFANRNSCRDSDVNLTARRPGDKRPNPSSHLKVQLGLLQGATTIRRDGPAGMRET